MSNNQRVAVITSDSHAGADLLAYRPYLERRWHDEFDRWAANFVNPFESEHLLTNDPSCNWDSDLRARLLESQGVVAEVIFPNTVPPFYPQTQFFVHRRHGHETSTNIAGPGSRPTTGGWSSSATNCWAGGRGSPRSCSMTSTTPSPRSTGSPRPA